MKSIGSKFIFILILFFLVNPTERVFGQMKGRIIPFPDWSATWEDDDDVVFELVEIKLSDKPLSLGITFASDDCWLKEMKLTVKNVSKHKIVSFNVGGGLVESIDKALEPNQSFQYGISWLWKADPHSKKKQDRIFRPGETIELDYSNVSELTKRVLSKVGEAEFHKLIFMGANVRLEKGDIALPKMRFRQRPPR